MRGRTLFAGAVGAASVAVAGNRLLQRRAGTLENPLPGVERVHRWRGMDVTYTVAGDPKDQDLLLFHGIHAAASSNEFEPIFEQLAEEYRVIAVDLPGFGRSDRPPLGYTASFYTDFVREFAGAVAERPIVMASSLTGAFAADACEDADFERLVLICPTADTGSPKPWLERLIRSPVVGSTLFSALASKTSLRYFYDRDGFYDPANVDPERVDYAWESAHQPGARYAPAAFAANTLDPEFDLETKLAEMETPTTLIWGRDTELVPLREGRRLAETADLDLIVVDYSTLLPHVEHPEAFLEYLTAELEHIG